MGPCVLKTVVVTNDVDERAMRKLFGGCTSLSIISNQVLRSRYYWHQYGKQIFMKSLLCLTFQVRDVNKEYGNMVHNYLLNKNDSINWDNDDTLSLASLTGSLPADPPDDDSSDKPMTSVNPICYWAMIIAQ